MIGSKIIHLQDVDSTNNYVANMVKEGICQNGTVIMAENQFGGRGQRGSEWVVDSGKNLTFSFFLSDVNLAVSRQFDLSRVLAIVLVDFFKENSLEAVIKWPNDILVGRKKISGVLIENQIRNGLVSQVIVGVGINVNQIDFGELSATSFCLEKDKQFNLKELLFSFIQVFNQKFDSLLALDPLKLNVIYEKMLFGFEEPMCFNVGGDVVNGIIKNVDKKGLLHVDINGIVNTFDLKEISFIY